MDSVTLNVTGCILGEIGTEFRSRVTANDIYVDGSGGYWWSADTTFMIGGFSTGVNAIRSGGESIFLFAYSTLNSGDVSALGNSILMLVQSQIPEEPKLFDGSCIWNAFIGKPSVVFVDTLVPIQGSAWIEKTPSSKLMGLAWYQLFYMHQNDTSWVQIGNKITVGKHNGILVNWDTHGLPPGAYTVKLVLCDNTLDSNKIEALKTINLLPKFLGINENINNPISATIFPNPVNRTSVLSIKTPLRGNMTLTVVDISGKTVTKSLIKLADGKNIISMGDLNLTPGVYCCILETGAFRKIVNFLKK